MTKQKPGINLIGADGKLDERRADIYFAVCDAVQARMDGDKLVFPVNRLKQIDEVLGRAMDAVQAQVSLLEAGGVTITERVIKDVVVEAFARMDAADERQAHADNQQPAGAQQVTGRRSPMTLSFIKTGQE